MLQGAGFAFQQGQIVQIVEKDPLLIPRVILFYFKLANNINK